MTRTVLACIAAAGIALVPAVGCRQILGIEERELTGGTGGAGGTGPSEELCKQYCNAVTSACPPPDGDVYPSLDACLNTCSFLPVGEPGTTAGNSVHCRLHQADQASKTGDLATFCPAAGPAGSNLCGTDCEVYCKLIGEVCVGTFPSIFQDESQCLELCPTQIPDHPPFGVPTPDEDSIQCRLYHMTLALQSEGSLAEHCPHAQGLSKCIP